jgi:hypothetical protein
MKSRSKTQPKFPQFLFYLKIAGGEVCDRGEDVERWLGASKPQKPLYFRRFSYQSATVGLPIGNPDAISVVFGALSVAKRATDGMSCNFWSFL